MFAPKLIRSSLLSTAILSFFAACGGDSSGPEPSVATTISANSSTTLTAPAGSGVTELPSVLVRDQRGAAMASVPVSFNVVTGGGTVTQSSATTNSSGVATVGGWTLGTTVGTNTLVASSGSLTPVTFTANAVAGSPASITKTAGDSQSAQVGTPVSVAPSVIVKDANGNAVPNAAVVFAVSSGGGTVTAATQTTSSTGVATVGSWTLGTTSGINTLSVSAGSVAPVTFSATGTAGTPATVTKLAGDNQSAAGGTVVPVAPSIAVRDANGNAVAGVTVIFSVGTGGGSVTGGTQTTNAAGNATVGSWTLGSAAGTNTLIVNAGNLAAVTFTATATGSAACSTATTYSIGAVVAGTLSTSDCQFSDGSYVDFYGVSVPINAYLFNESASFDTYLLLYSSTGDPIAVNDDFNGTTNSTIKALIPTGNYLLGASSFDAAVTGPYNLSSSITSSSIDNCEDVFVARGIQTTQTLLATDCANSSFYSDDMFIYLAAGQTLTVTMTSTAFDAYLEIYNEAGLVASNDNISAATTDAKLTYTSPTGSLYLISPTSALAGATGSYTITIQ
jgi:hypothetical protein